MSDVLDRKATASGITKAQAERLVTRDSLRAAIRNEKFEWHSDRELNVATPLIERSASHEIEIVDLPRWDDVDPVLAKLVQESSIAVWQTAAREFTPDEWRDTGHLAVRVAPSVHSESRGYYVSRAYRGLWFGLLMLGIVWGFVGGVAITSGAFLSPSAVLMGVFALVVLAATLFVAGSRDRIRRRK